MEVVAKNKYLAALEILAGELSVLHEEKANFELAMKEKRDTIRGLESKLHNTIEAMRVVLVPLMQDNGKIDFLIHPNQVIRGVVLDLIREQNEE